MEVSIRLILKVSTDETKMSVLINGDISHLTKSENNVFIGIVSVPISDNLKVDALVEDGKVNRNYEVVEARNVIQNKLYHANISELYDDNGDVVLLGSNVLLQTTEHDLIKIDAVFYELVEVYTNQIVSTVPATVFSDDVVYGELARFTNVYKDLEVLREYRINMIYQVNDQTNVSFQLATFGLGESKMKFGNRLKDVNIRTFIEDLQMTNSN